MSRVIDATIHVSDVELPTTSNFVHSLLIAGDTLRICQTKTPLGNDPGVPGEWCWDNQYIYVCVAFNTWTRVALNVF